MEGVSNQKNSSNASKSRTTDQLAVTDGPMAAPQVVMVGAWIGVAECALGLGYGVFLLIRDLMGYRDEAAVISGWGTALWFLLIFGAVFAGAIMLLRGARWGRGPIIMLNLCLLGWPITCSARALFCWLCRRRQLQLRRWSVCLVRRQLTGLPALSKLRWRTRRLTHRAELVACHRQPQGARALPACPHYLLEWTSQLQATGVCR